MSAPVSPDDFPEVLVMAEAAELMRVQPATLKAWAEKGLVPGECFGVWRFRKSLLLATMDGPRKNFTGAKDAEGANEGAVRPVCGKRRGSQ